MELVMKEDKQKKMMKDSSTMMHYHKHDSTGNMHHKMMNDSTMMQHEHKIK